jgi:hypothetical protein
VSIYNKYCPLCKGDGDDLCSFCGGKMSHARGGIWSGDLGTIFCCSQCALIELPRFLADSLCAGNLSETQGEVQGRIMAAIQAGLASRAEWREWNGPELYRSMNLNHQKALAEEKAREAIYAAICDEIASA